MNNEYRTAEQGISNVEENTYFIILHSLFDIRYWTPCKKYQTLFPPCTPFAVNKHVFFKDHAR